MIVIDDEEENGCGFGWRREWVCDRVVQEQEWWRASASKSDLAQASLVGLRRDPDSV